MCSKKISLREYQLLLLSIIKMFHNYCEQNNFTYYMSYGTFLGAIRHKGFIPWDDDIDICMPREDYDRFLIDTLNYNNPFMINPYTYNSLHKSFVLKNDVLDKKNIIGWFDIFPIDYLSDNYHKSKKIIKRAHFMEIGFFSQELPTLSLFKKQLVEEKNLLLYGRNVLARIYYKFFCNYQRKMKAYLKKCKREKAIYCSDGLHTMIEIAKPIPSNIFSSKKLYNFEDTFLYGVSDYNCYLMCLYGKDYMIPPQKKVQHAPWLFTD